MLFLIISTPRPDAPSSVAHLRKAFWVWLEEVRASGVMRHFYARTGRGAVAVVDVDSNNGLHRIMSEWSERIPTTLEVYPLVDDNAAKAYLDAHQAVAKDNFSGDPALYSKP